MWKWGRSRLFPACGHLLGLSHDKFPLPYQLAPIAACYYHTMFFRKQSRPSPFVPCRSSHHKNCLSAVSLCRRGDATLSHSSETHACLPARQGFPTLTSLRSVHCLPPRGNTCFPDPLPVRFSTLLYSLRSFGAPRIELGPLGPKPSTLPLCYAPLARACVACFRVPVRLRRIRL